MFVGLWWRIFNNCVCFCELAALSIVLFNCRKQRICGSFYHLRIANIVLQVTNCVSVQLIILLTFFSTFIQGHSLILMYNFVVKLKTRQNPSNHYYYNIIMIIIIDINESIYKNMILSNVFYSKQLTLLVSLFQSISIDSFQIFRERKYRKITIEHWGIASRMHAK